MLTISIILNVVLFLVATHYAGKYDKEYALVEFMCDEIEKITNEIRARNVKKGEGAGKTIKAFKATDKDGKCRDIKFVVGKTYSTKGKLELCKNGLHFCKELLNVYNYYPKDETTRIFEIEILGEMLEEGDKSATDKLKVVRELSYQEIFGAWLKNGNSGYGNSGYGNSGDRNSGNGNSGYGNSGNRNSGDWNSGDGNSGYFNTKIPLYFFNKPCDIQYTKELENKIRSLNVKPIVTYVETSGMTEEEKNNNPSHKTTGGFLRKTDRMNWNHLTESDKEYIKSLPNFDDNIFEKISGVRLTVPKTIKVIVNGVEKEIDYAKAKELGLV